MYRAEMLKGVAGNDRVWVWVWGIRMWQKTLGCGRFSTWYIVRGELGRSIPCLDLHKLKLFAQAGKPGVQVQIASFSHLQVRSSLSR